MIKEKPEDFMVEEVIDLDLSGGDYTYAKLTKIDWNTVDAINEIVKRLGVKRSNVSFAGTKDKFAVTSQYVSLYKVGKDRINSLNIKDVSLEVVGTGNKPISLGDLKGNKFRIKFSTKNKTDFIVNYFGPQRFSKNNKDVGKAIIKKDFKKACALIESHKVSRHLERFPTDFVGALKKLDKKVLSLYVNSYQSYLWNKAVEQFLGKKFLNEKIESFSVPLVSFDMEITNPDFEKIYEKLLKEECLSLKGFLIKQMPEVTPTQAERDLIVDVTGFENDWGYVKFFLPKGAYATVVLEKLESFLS